MHKTCYVFFSMVCARLNFFKNFIFIFSPRRSRRGTLGISSPGGPVEEPLKPFCFFFSLRRLSSSVVFQWGSLRQTLDLSKTTNEKVPWRRPSIIRSSLLAGIIQKPSELSMIFPLKYQFRSGIWVPPMFDDTFRGDFQPGFFLHSRVDAVKYVKKMGTRDHRVQWRETSH